MMNCKSITLAAVACAAALAQGPWHGGTPPDPATMAQRRVNMMAARLNLTDAQKASALTIFTNAATSAQSIRTSMETNHASMKTAIQKNDTAAINQVASAMGTLEGQLMAINSKAAAAFYATLTPTQKAAYDSMPRGGWGGASRMMRGGRKEPQ